MIDTPAVEACASSNPRRLSPPRSSRVPLAPQTLLSAQNCFVVGDTRFRAAARLRQSLWREASGFGIGQHHVVDKPNGATAPLGSRLAPEAGRQGANFISPEIFGLVRREVALSEEGALIETERLTLNLLSSTALAFNLFGPLALAPDLATAVFRTLLPDFVHTVEDIRFETSPGRGDPRFLADGSAFDVAIDIITPDGEPGTVFIEVKYTEGLSGPAAPARPRYNEVSRELGLYTDPDSPTLRSRAIEQLWRLHMLAGLAVRRGVTPRALFVTIGPQLNRRVAAALTLYAAELVSPIPRSDQEVGFVALTLEAVISALRDAGDSATAAALTERYVDFKPVVDLILASDIVPAAEPLSVPRPACTEPWLVADGDRESGSNPGELGEYPLPCGQPNRAPESTGRASRNSPRSNTLARAVRAR